MSTRDYEQLVQFLYRVPVGLIEIDRQGEVRLMNAYASQVFMPLSGPSWTVHFFDILAPHAPELASRIAGYESAFGTIMSNERIKLLESWYAFTVERLEEDSYMVEFRNVTEEVEREQRLQSAITEEAEQRGRVEIAASVLHDIGNALGGLSTKVARLLAETSWREVTELKRLQKLVEEQREALVRALGAQRQAALSTFLSELVASLEGRSEEIRGTAGEMAQTLEHVSETRKSLLNRTSAIAPQLAVASLLTNGGYDHHLRQLRRTYQEQMNRMLQAISDYFPAETCVTQPTGDHILWLEMPERFDAIALYHAALQRGISIAPGPIFSASGECFYRCFALNTTLPWSETVDRAMRTLGQLAKQQMAVNLLKNNLI